MRKLFKLILVSVLPMLFYNSVCKGQFGNNQEYKIDLAGDWLFQIDSLDQGIPQQWFSKKLVDNIRLPGSMATNGKGNDITVSTPWTGSIFDSSWFVKPEYFQYHQPGNIKIPFWLQPVKYYKGAAWYQKTVIIPASWKDRHLELFIERSHWETSLWVDDKKIGMQNSLGTPHVFDLTKELTAGTHQITIRIDNRIKEVNVGENSHSISDHTQSNWNGMIGHLYLAARPAIYIDEVQIYPDLKKKEVGVHISIRNTSGKPVRSVLEILAVPGNSQAEKLKTLKLKLIANKDSTFLKAVYPMGERPLLWDEHNPNLYTLKVNLVKDKELLEERKLLFGLREFATHGTQFTINGNFTFLRGTLESAIFPKTGYPPVDTASWMRIYKIARSYGLNHLRFHSWCPPEAAFEAADRAGFYLQIECSSWANWGTALGDGKPIDEYIYDESNRIVKAYGNHPSFCMMTYGNEPGGKNHVRYLTEFVTYWKNKDPRRLYTTGAGWPVIPQNNYNSTSDPRIQQWGAGLKSIINGQPPRNDYDWRDSIAKFQHPTVSHEIGQWCVYPDFKEITKYTGVLKAKNFEIFQERLVNNGMGQLADSFLMASGKLQALCYKADIEAALRTPGFGGFQLLDLHDFPGQGTALVGVLNPFWDDKGYITAQEYSRFCNSTVPLTRFPKMVYLNNETLSVPVEVAHFGASPLVNIVPDWNIKDAAGKVLFQGKLPQTTISLGNSIPLGKVTQGLSAVTSPARLTLTVSLNNYQNSWDFFVFPASLPVAGENILVTQLFDEKARQKLNEGGSVLLTLKKGAVKDEIGGKVAVGFSSIFWNTAWTNGQAPHTLGILCNPQHPALQEFPTEFHSNWQWWDAMSNSDVIILDSVAKGLQPIVRVIDDWVTAQPLGLIFECRVGKGRLIVTGIDLLNSQTPRPEARQLLYSLKKYMASSRFNPVTEVSPEKVRSLTK